MLNLQATLIQNQGCSSISVFDTTGDYDVTLNPGGYGTPNPATTDVTSATLLFSIQGFNSVSPKLYTITNFSDILTPSGITINSSDVTNTPTWPDGYYTITYSIVALGITYTKDITVVFYCGIQCCVRKMSLSVKTPVENIEKVHNIFYANWLFWTMTAAACCGNGNSFEEKLKELKQICGGCGDSSTSGRNSFPLGTGGGFDHNSGSRGGGCCG